MATSNQADWLIPMGRIALSFIPVAAGVVRLTLLAGGGPLTAENARLFGAPMPDPATGRGSAPGMDAPRLCNWPWRRNPGANPTAASSALRSTKRIDPRADDGCGLAGKPCNRRVLHSQEAIGCGVRGRMTQ